MAKSFVDEIDSQPICNIVDIRKKVAIVLPWEGAVDGVAEALATCVQKTFNYLLGLKPLTGRKPVIRIRFLTFVGPYKRMYAVLTWMGMRFN